MLTRNCIALCAKHAVCDHADRFRYTAEARRSDIIMLAETNHAALVNMHALLECLSITMQELPVPVDTE